MCVCVGGGVYLKTLELWSIRYEDLESECHVGLMFVYMYVNKMHIHAYVCEIDFYI